MRHDGQAFLVKTYILITTDLMTFLLVSKPMSTTMSMKDLNLMDAVVTTLHFTTVELLVHRNCNRRGYFTKKTF